MRLTRLFSALWIGVLYMTTNILLIAAEPVSLFDGKTLDGWKGDPEWWGVKDGAITGGSTEHKIPHNFFISTKESFHNFELTLKIKLTGDPSTGMINSGIQIRSVRVPDSTEMSGYQVDAGDGWWGKLYDESRRHKVISESAQLAAVQSAVRPDDWNEVRIRAEGPRIQSWINQVPALDYIETAPNVALDGHIAIQIHSGGIAQVQVKDIFVTRLPPTPNTPTWDKVGHPKAKPKPPLKTGNAAKADPKTPQEQWRTFQIPEGFEIELVAAEDPDNGIGKFIAVYFDALGRLWTMTALEYPVDGNENPAAAEALYKSRGRDKILVIDKPFGPGPHQPRVFADGLAIPLGILPMLDGCYTLHGPDIVFLHDRDQDGKADDRTTILTGFGVQDSHLFPHQFTRAPGNWIWFAQGAFNYSKVRRPSDPQEKAITFDQTRMAKFRPNGEQFTITSNGPCNIWGLVLNGEGEAFIQEANDFGYSVMPFLEFANYPGCSNKQWKPYAPEFPSIADFRLGGTGLSGLALSDDKGPFPEPWNDVMFVANPITRTINAVKLHHDGPHWRATRLPDFITSSDEMFRPVAITIGPDGCLYITDWYNSIISHNEVPRNHPDRDKTRGRIWRVRPKAQRPFEVLDFTSLSDKQLLAKLGSDSLAQSQLAWQTIIDTKRTHLGDSLRAIIEDGKSTPAAAIQALWALEGLQSPHLNSPFLGSLLSNPNRNLRRETVRLIADLTVSGNDGNAPLNTSHAFTLLGKTLADADPQVRSESLRVLGVLLDRNEFPKPEKLQFLHLLLTAVKAPLPGPTAPSSQNSKNIIKVGPAYEREFERYLIRQFVEKHPALLESYFLTPEAEEISAEARLLASFALPAPANAIHLAKQLPRLEREPETHEILTITRHLQNAEVAKAFQTAIESPRSQPAILNAITGLRGQLDISAITPLITSTVQQLLSNPDLALQLQGLEVCAACQLQSLEPTILQLSENPALQTMAFHALAEIQPSASTAKDLIIRFESLTDPLQRDSALHAIASCRSPELAPDLLQLLPKLSQVQKRNALNRFVSTPDHARPIIAAIKQKKFPITDLDPSLWDRLQALLPKDPDLEIILQESAHLFRPVLTLNGSDDAWTQTDLSITGPLTIETWIRFDATDRLPKNVDGIFASPGQVDLNFHDSRLRVYTYAPMHDVVISSKPITPGIWTHVAATRDAHGIWTLYQDGEPTGVSTKPHLAPIQNPRIAWTTAKGGTHASLAEFRVWNIQRSHDEIFVHHDRTISDQTPHLIFNSSADQSWGTLQRGAKISHTSDLPPILTQEQARQLDQKFSKLRTLAKQPGDPKAGKLSAAICMACHLIQGEGIAIGPDLSGIGAMGTEAIIRNILTPNAALESAYYIYRVELLDNSIREGFLANQDAESIQLRIPGAADQRIPRNLIRDSKFLRRSLMPEGLLDHFSDQQIIDLFAYLHSLK